MAFYKVKKASGYFNAVLPTQKITLRITDELFYSINFFCTKSLINKEMSLIQTQFWMRSIFIFPGKMSKFLHTDKYSTVNIPGDTIFCSSKEESMFHTWKKIHFSLYLFCKRHGGRLFMFACLPVLQNTLICHR